jgi:hypothetical protein
MILHPRGPIRAAAVAIFCLCCAARLEHPAHAQPIKPWTPPAGDSLLAWSAEARARFHSNLGDSLGGANFEAYDRVGRVGRRLLRSLGRAGMNQAHAIEPVIDSLGLDTEVALDPANPAFALLMVHNPFRPAADAAGFLYWWRQDDLRMQGVRFRNGRTPRMRVWWTAQEGSPYEWAVVDRLPTGEGLNFTLFRLTPDGYYWRADQYQGRGPDLSDAYQSDLVDINGDQRPELLVWAKAAPDSLFEECGGCPGLITERIYTETNPGFGLHDTRLVPSPYASFVLFIRLLREQNRAAAARLLVDPARLEQAIALGWGGARRRGGWKVEWTQADRAWPEWLAMAYHGAKGDQRWIVHFAQKDGRWLIKDWLPNATAGGNSAPSPAISPSHGGASPGSAPADSARGSRGTRPGSRR